MGITRYKEAIELLNARQTPPEILKANRANNKSGAPERSLWPHLERLGLDEYVSQPGIFIHVAGTKGKGSTCSMINAVINKHRMKYGSPKKIGLYTSPHVSAVRERIQINSEPLSEEKFAEYYFDMHKKVNDTDPTYFRALTLMAFNVFYKEGVDVAIIEVGVGGTNDATNVFTAPAVTAITSLGIDHTKTLGDNIKDIAGHKAGIIKQTVPCFTVPQEYQTALEVLRLTSNQKEANLTIVNHSKDLPFLDQAKLADFQKENAALGIAVARRYLRDRNLREDVCHDQNELVEMIRDAQLLGRGQIVQVNDMQLFIDSAHTQESLRAAAIWYSRESIDQFPRALIYGHDSFRDLKVLIQALHDALQKEEALPTYLVFCGDRVNENEPNSPDLTHVSRDSLEESNREYWQDVSRNERKVEQVYCSRSAEEALKTLSSLPEVSKLQVLVTGNLRLTGAINTFLQQGKISGQ